MIKILETFLRYCRNQCWKLFCRDSKKKKNIYIHAYIYIYILFDFIFLLANVCHNVYKT